MRSSAVAWRIRPALSVLRIRERRLRREVSVGAPAASPGLFGSTLVSAPSSSGSSGSSVSVEVGWRSTRL